MTGSERSRPGSLQVRRIPPGATVLLAALMVLSAGRGPAFPAGGINWKNEEAGWKVFESGRYGFRISLPPGARVVGAPPVVKVMKEDGFAKLVFTRDLDAFMKRELELRKPQRLLGADEPSLVFFYTSGNGRRYVEHLSFKEKDDAAVVALASAPVSKPDLMRELAISVCSFQPIPLKGAPRGDGPAAGDSSAGASPARKAHVELVGWNAPDGSSTMLVPRGWNTRGFTRSYGRNGYLGFVSSFSPDSRYGFAALYGVTMHQGFSGGFMFGGAGAPPEPKSYATGMFLGELASIGGIQLPDAVFEKVERLPEMERRYSEQVLRQAAEAGIMVNPASMPSYAIVRAVGTFSSSAGSRELEVYGVIQYAAAAGVTAWGPAPLAAAFAPAGELAAWEDVYVRMLTSWSRTGSWLSSYRRVAAADASSALSHFRRMRRIIHEGEERRASMGMRQWDAEQREKLEEFYDTFHALGGEERYDDPVTGREIDVPTGADKYLYDHLGNVWVGVETASPHADELIRKLKDEGFHELKLHEH